MHVVQVLSYHSSPCANDERERSFGLLRSSSSGFSYVPGALEVEWFPQQPHSVEGKLCQLALKQAKGSQIDEWLAFSGTSSRGKLPRQPNRTQTKLLSKLTCSDGREEYLEPLTGVARHPRANVGCQPKKTFGVDIFNTAYLVVQNRCGSGSGGGTNELAHRHGRNLFYDLGAGPYDSKLPLGADGGYGPSIPVFSRLYENNCIVFDEIWAWEYTQIPPPTYWEKIPPAIRGKLHFMNIPVEPEPHSNSFLELLKSTAKPEDFVVVKVDVDNSAVEESVVESIARDPQLARLVDEMFFEYHFYGEAGFDFGWGSRNMADRPSTMTNATVETALNLMRRLRNRGIRAHFWI